MAAARLSHRLHLDQAVRVRPVAPVPETITLINPSVPLPDLIQVALAHHPSISACAAAVATAEVRHKQELCRPLLPTLWLGYSAGAFGGGSNLFPPELSHFASRSDFDVQVYWTLLNFGMGNRRSRSNDWPRSAKPSVNNCAPLRRYAVKLAPLTRKSPPRNGKSRSPTDA